MPKLMMFGIAPWFSCSPAVFCTPAPARMPTRALREETIGTPIFCVLDGVPNPSAQKAAPDANVDYVSRCARRANLCVIWLLIRSQLPIRQLL